MKIAVAQLNYHIGNFEQNTAKIIDAIQMAKEEGAELVLFSELAVCGYPPRDFLEFRDFIDQCDKAIHKIAGATKGIAAVVGCPSVNPCVEGKDLFNSAYFISHGKVEYIAHKTLLPTYDVFDEYRYFEPNTEFKVVKYKGKKIALTVCEDIWNIGNENPMYTACPMDELIKQNPDFIVNISASPFDYDHSDNRFKILKANTQRYNIPVFYVNHVGAQTELIFDGGSLIFDKDGNLFDELPYFQESIKLYDTDDIGAGTSQKSGFTAMDAIERIHHALVLGIYDYFHKLGFKKAILGLSGGIDSAVTLVLLAQALGSENVRAVLMPSEFSTEHSVTDAKELVENIVCPYDIIPIQDIFETYLQSLEPQFEGTLFGLAEENIQARIRGNFLMAIANKFGYILLNTSNKSEIAVGYGTLYGDLAGGLSVLGDVYKTQVYELANYINRNGEIIPQNIIDKPPSAELRPGQKDTDSLPPYEILDDILYQYIEKRKGPKELVEQGFEKRIVDRVLKLVNSSEFKRHQTPPILRVSPKAFGMGRRMPIVGKYLT